MILLFDYVLEVFHLFLLLIVLVFITLELILQSYLFNLDVISELDVGCLHIVLDTLQIELLVLFPLLEFDDHLRLLVDLVLQINDLVLQDALRCLLHYLVHFRSFLEQSMFDDNCFFLEYSNFDVLVLSFVLRGHQLVLQLGVCHFIVLQRLGCDLYYFYLVLEMLHLQRVIIILVVTVLQMFETDIE
jgi:hypothetical protein